MQISIVNGSIEYDGVSLLEQIYFDLHDKEKIALIGRNGCGKTSLLRALMGEIPLVRGTGEENFGYYVTGKPKIGYLQQVVFQSETNTLYEEVKNAFSDLIELEEKMNRALSAMQGGSEDAVRSYTYLHELYENSGGYGYEKECAIAIRKFGFSEEETNRPINCFSGGQRTKIALLKLLLSRPEVLLLDEPTNHLDIEAVEWLENYLRSYRFSCVIVSHDRMFLDRIVNVVYEIEYGEMKRYRGNYTDFCNQKQAAYEKALKDATVKYKEIERLSKIVERFRYKANKAAMAQAKLSQIKRLGTVDEPSRYDMRTFHTNFQPQDETVRKVLVVDKLSFGYTTELGNLSFILEKGTKLGVVGPNGCGKSTFVRTLMGKIKPLSGNYYYGLHTKIGYFDQTETQSESEDTVLNVFHSRFPMLTDTEARSALGAFMMTGEDVFKPVCTLSGGEKVRLALCTIFKERPNVLILDEPTNHMDIVGKETIEKMLREYTGTLIIVSHDRYLINTVCDIILGFRDGKPTLFDGRYEDYEKVPTESVPAFCVAAPEKKKEKKLNTSPLKEQQRKEKRIAQLEKQINANDIKISELSDRLNAPDVCSDYKKIMELQSEIDALQSDADAMMAEWETLLGDAEN